MIQYALMVNPTIYVSCIKKFWTFVSIKKSNDVVRLQALIDRKKVIIIDDIIKQALRLDDATGVDCLPNEEIFAELARMGYEKPMAVEDAAEGEDDDNEVSAEPTPPSPTPATPPPPPTQEHIPSPHQAQNAQPSSPPPQQPSQSVDISQYAMNLLTLLETCATLTKQAANLEQDKIAQAIEITKLNQRFRRLEKKRQSKSSGLKRMAGGIDELDADEDVTVVDAKEDINADVQGRLAESQAKVYHLDLQHAKKVLSMQDTDETEPAEVEEVIEVVTVAKLMTKVVTIAATTITDAQVPQASAPRKVRCVVIQDPEETATASVIMHSEVKSKDKGKGILIEEPKPLKRQVQIKQDEAFARQLEAELNANINWDDVMEQRIDEDTEELKTHLQIVANDDDDVYTEATPLALKVHVVDYQIHHEYNKPYYKIIRADGTNQLFLSFITLLKNFDREDLKMLWKLIQEIFQSSEPKNFSDDFLLNTLKIMYEKPNVEASIWIDQKGRYGLAKDRQTQEVIGTDRSEGGLYVLDNFKDPIVMLLLVEKKYPLTRFTLEQMLNNVRLEVKEESEMSLELLSLMRRQLQEGYIPE
nr:hypothetical protein [Tanacetum cinerariifolium]